ncbi:MAG: metallophosphoesterase [Acidaminococcaceae bacterium]
MFAPELPRSLLLVLGWLFDALLLASVLQLLRDCWGLVMRGLSLSLGSGQLSSNCWAVVVMFCALTLSGYGLWASTVQAPAVKTTNITLTKLPATLDGFKLVQLSDLHISAMTEVAQVEDLVMRVNALQADVIVLTGDIIDGTPANRWAALLPLRKLQARNGVYGVVGNHEYYSGVQSWLKAFERLGLKILVNEHVVLTSAGQQIVLAGTTDWSSAKFDEVPPDVVGALRGVPASAVKILLTHQPRGVAFNNAQQVDLQLSGHTHGGMVVGFAQLVALFNEGYVSGLYQLGNLQLYVSNGTGLWSGFPLRLGVPAEISQILLHSPQQG